MKKEHKKPKTEKKRLGRGLSALLGESLSNENAADPTTLPIERIEVNPDQPRRIFHEEDLEELSISIQNQGVLQPIVVRPYPEKAGYYQIIAGERRWRAAMRVGLNTMPVVIKNIAEEETLVLSLVENIQRENLGPLEEAYAYERLMLSQQLTQKELAKLVGKSRSVIANVLRLLSLPKKVQEMVDDGVLSNGHARALLGVPSIDHMESIATHIVDQGWSVRKTEDFVKKLQEKTTNVENHTKEKTINSEDSDKANLEQQLSLLLDCKVYIRMNGQKPALNCKFNSLDDFQRFVRRLNQTL